MLKLSYQPYIVVLGHLMDKNGGLNKESSQRVAYAAQVNDELSSLALILCGWAYRTDSNITLATAMKNNLKRSRPDLTTSLLLQPLSRDTVGDAFFSRLLLEHICEARKPDIVVVTSSYHVKRAISVFEFIFHGYASSVRVQGCKGAECDESRLDSESESIGSFHSTFSSIEDGNMNAIRDAMAIGHPFYNGCIHPVIGSLESVVDELWHCNQTT